VEVEEVIEWLISYKTGARCECFLEPHLQFLYAKVEGSGNLTR